MSCRNHTGYLCGILGSGMDHIRCIFDTFRNFHQLIGVKFDLQIQCADFGNGIYIHIVDPCECFATLCQSVIDFRKLGADCVIIAIL